MCGVFPNRQVYIRIVLSACNLFNMKFDFTTYTYFSKEEDVKFGDIFETNIDIEDENKIIDLENKIEINEKYEECFKKLHEEIFKETWLGNEGTTSESSKYLICLCMVILMMILVVSGILAKFIY